MAFFSRKNRYNRYFEGYEQRTDYDRYGNEKQKYVYVGNYFQPDMTESQFRIRKAINIFLLIASYALNLAAGIIPTAAIPMNNTKVMGVAQCLAILSLIATTVYVVTHASSPYAMEIHAHKGSHERLTVVSLITWLVLAAVFIAAVAASFIYAKGFSLNVVLWLLAYLASAASIFVIWFLEKNTDYIILPPDHF